MNKKEPVINNPVDITESAATNSKERTA